MYRGCCNAFSLAELLITLAIVGGISVFAIPKVLQAQQDTVYRANAKQAVMSLQAAFQAYRFDNQLTGATRAVDILAYLPAYVNKPTGIAFDEVPGGWSATCGDTGGPDGTIVCYRLHNGAILETTGNISFGGTDTLNAVYFYLDPDGRYSGSDTGPGKSVMFLLYADGKIKTWGTALPNTLSNAANSPFNPTPAYDPSWFGWD